MGRTGQDKFREGRRAGEGETGAGWAPVCAASALPPGESAPHAPTAQKRLEDRTSPRASGV